MEARSTRRRKPDPGTTRGPNTTILGEPSLRIGLPDVSAHARDLPSRLTNSTIIPRLWTSEDCIGRDVPNFGPSPNIIGGFSYDGHGGELGTTAMTEGYTAGITDFWSESAMFSLPKWPIMAENDPDTGRMRIREMADLENDLVEAESFDPDTHCLRQQVPMMFPSVPSPPENEKLDIIPNPFLEGCEERHATLDGRAKPRIPANGKVDGYIKVQFSSFSDQDDTSASLFSLSSKHRSQSKRKISYGDRIFHNISIPTLPPNFATGLELDAVDRKLWTFRQFSGLCQTLYPLDLSYPYADNQIRTDMQAYCPGRTLLRENYWRDDLMAIAVANDCTLHALLSFTTSYALDYHPTEEMRKRANLHYRTAVRLIGNALARTDTCTVGKADAVVAAIILVFSNDIVNWEIRRPQVEEPLWRAGARAARTILDRTDPGYRYYFPENVQSSWAWQGQANWVAYVDIMAQPVTPLEDEHTTESFQWLLEGTWIEARKIHSITGLCPKLLHMYAQITHITARLAKVPDSQAVLVSSATRLQNRLPKLWQWSTLSSGYGSTQELFDSCELGTGGTVSDAVKVTELTAQSYALAAEIYLHCRFFRKPRSHPDVRNSVGNLAECIQRMPCTGPLFTSQSPFAAVFILSVVAYLPEHRMVAQNWFETVLEGAQCRSSVPPVWSSVQKLWKWMDNELLEASYLETQSVIERAPWWEDMVNQLVEESGVLSLV